MEDRAKRTVKKSPKRATARPPARASKSKASEVGESASERITTRIAELGDWRGDVLGHVRSLIRGADPGIVEEWKWNVPVWSREGIICTGETYKSAVKLTFAKGASLRDPRSLFNSSLDGNVRRAIDIHDGDAIDETALQDLIRAAVALNLAGKKK